MTEALDTSPGSFNEFAANHPDSSNILADFTKAAGEHREALAEELGITPEELHVSPNPAHSAELEDPTRLSA